MSEEAMKLTTYFGERSRLKGRLLADELLDIHARREIRTSVLLRGIQGFGAKHRRRTDRLLTLSEDLPLVSVAVDTPEQIETLLRDMGTIGHEGLVTLERARLYGAGVSADSLESAPREPIKLTVYMGRHERVKNTPAFVATCQLLHEAEVSGATVLLGVDGTSHGERRRARFFAGNTDVPMMVVAVGQAPQIELALTNLRQILPGLMLTIERVRVCKRDGELLQPPQENLDQHKTQMRQKLTIVSSEAAQHGHKPLHLELIRRLRLAQAAGVTSLRGIWGFHGKHAPHGDRLLSIRRHVPVVTDVVDTPERIAALFEIADELTSERGLITSEIIPATSTLNAHNGDLTHRLSPPPA